MTIFIEGRGLWSPGFAGPDAWLRRQRDEQVQKPPVEIVASRMKRATSIATRAAVEATIQAGREAGWPLDSFATIFGSRHGEIRIAIEQMTMMQEDSGIVSPARFKNSVHNTASGLFSISAQNRQFTTALAAGPQTFAMALLEAFALLGTETTDRVVVTVTEEPLPAPIDSFSGHQALGVAFALALEPSPQTLGELDLPCRGDAPAPDLPVPWHEHTSAGTLALLQALKDRRSGTVAVAPGWVVEVHAWAEAP